ncbi:MAG: hypothetical protein M3016_00370 [Actinomycetota bacterium]|nr:hypothetical protein [Actinomycetota bacterium]
MLACPGDDRLSGRAAHDHRVELPGLRVAENLGVCYGATVERFRDPRSGRVMRVWEDAAGTRHYVPDDDTG